MYSAKGFVLTLWLCQKSVKQTMAMLKPLNPSQKKKQVDITFFIYTRATGTVREFETKVTNANENKFYKQTNPSHKLHKIMDSSGYISLFQDCIAKKSFPEIKLTHAHLKQTGFISDAHLQHTLINAYVKFRKMEDAFQVFDEMPNRMVRSWNIMIAAYARQGFAEKALALFRLMQDARFRPDQHTFSTILVACAKLRDLEEGMKIHDEVVEGGFLSDVFVANGLIDMYAKCGTLEAARHVFNQMPTRDVVSWTSMITGYAHNRWGEEALELFRQMKTSGTKPNLKTFASILPVCANLAALEQGVEIHEEIIKSGLQCDVFVESSLVDMYAKCGNIEKARDLFDKMHRQDTVSWTVIIGGCAQNKMEEDAMKLFRQMKLVGVKPIGKTFTNVLPACANLAVLEQGMAIHNDIIRSGFENDIFVANAVIDMYAKCGSIGQARDVFDKMHQKNVSSWTAMIAGYGMHGFGKDALHLFELMEYSGMHADSVTLVCVLAACCHSGLVEEGQRYFDCMIKIYNIEPGMTHYSCMVDLLGRAGRVDEAKQLIDTMPITPDANVWKCLLSACRTHNHIKLGECAAQQLFVLDSNNSAPYVLLVNMYAAVGRWSDIAKIRKMMRDRGVKKTPGCSWIEVNKRVHTFLVGDKSHPQTEQIYAKLEKLACEMKSAGYVPNTCFVLNDGQQPEDSLWPE
ncbi:pentatricopeptide repeat-containing protein DOT4, chloroplastic [Cryptomeria japonica]|uniref:pentatricopeptide repeat-containing protein DOT4, chloroplastic n=1 Tax=Cryptomeria japonica TaxID=3369 RepID=UPI0027DA7E05|nr:pentatricopeptide repeat-containing protein DOT4, chloroplastic [Cryptomeria japonica]